LSVRVQHRVMASATLARVRPLAERERNADRVPRLPP